MTIHGGPGTLDVVARMLAGLWGEGRAPIPVEFVPLTEGQVIDAGDFSIDCFSVRHRDTDSFGFSFQSPARRHLRPDRLGQGEKHVSGGVDVAAQPEGKAGAAHQLVCVLFAFAIGRPGEAGRIAAEVHQSGEQPLGQIQIRFQFQIQIVSPHFFAHLVSWPRRARGAGASWRRPGRNPPPRSSR